VTAAADKVVAETLRNQGWEVLDKGWPDLLCYNKENRKVMAIELKRGKDSMRPDQKEMALVFNDLLGIPFHVAREDDIKAMMRKKGRVVVPGETLTNLKSDIQSLEWQMKYREREIADLKKQLESATFVFEALQNGKEPDMAHVWEGEEI